MSQYVNVQLTRAQCDAIIRIVGNELSSAWDDHRAMYGSPALQAANNGIERIAKARAKHPPRERSVADMREVKA